MRSTIEYEVAGTVCSLVFSHPGVSDLRTAAVRRYFQVGCELLIDLRDLPAWAKNIPAEAEMAALKAKPELFRYDMLRVPQGVTLSSTDWEMLPALPELRYLSITSAALSPADFIHAARLECLEILVLHTPALNDAFCATFPRMKQLRMLDVLGTPVTIAGIRSLREACPNAKIDADGER